MLIKNDPKSTLCYLDDLLKRAKGKDRKQAFLAIDVLQELFTTHLLSDEKKLQSFKDLVTSKPSFKFTDSELIDMYCEHMLRASYIEFVDVLESCSKDTLDHFRKMAITTITD